MLPAAKSTVLNVSIFCYSFDADIPFSCRSSIPPASGNVSFLFSLTFSCREARISRFFQVRHVSPTPPRSRPGSPVQKLNLDFRRCSLCPPSVKCIFPPLPELFLSLVIPPNLVFSSPPRPTPLLVFRMFWTRFVASPFLFLSVSLVFVCCWCWFASSIPWSAGFLSEGSLTFFPPLSLSLFFPGRLRFFFVVVRE